MPWPLPSTLVFAAGQEVPRRLEVQLLDGELIYGVMLSSEDPSERSELQLIAHGQHITFPLSSVRSVACAAALIPAPDSGSTVAPAPLLEHEELLNFHLVFVDELTLAGQTWGYLNQKAGGVYLYVRQAEGRFKALWIPRNALKSFRTDLPPPASPPPVAAAAMGPGIAAAAGSIRRNGLGPASNMTELAARLEAARKAPLMSLAEALFKLNLMEAPTYQALQSDKSDQLRAYIDARLASSELSEFQLEHARAFMLNTPEVNAEAFQVEPQAVAKVSWEVAARHSVVPLGMLAGILYVASPVPMNRELKNRLGFIADCHLVLVWAAKPQIDVRLARQNHLHEPPAALASSVKDKRPEVADQDLPSLLLSAQDEIQVQGIELHSNEADERSSVVRLVKWMITDAYKQKASDIHIETDPGEGLSRVRFRKDGELEDYLQLPPDLRAALVSRIKVMSKLDISEKRRPQDGKINFADFSDIKLELRVAILPTHDGLEDVVMRLLASSKPIPLAQLGFSERDEKIVKRLSQRPYGLILACGPTGSGKTTTLHSLLKEVNTEDRKIWTAEDPIEITQPGLRQLQVNPKIGLTFAAAMRAFLRADPDVIMIGEIRDAETARIAIEASLTGHLVLSTLHTNNAAESVVRLLDLGMDPMNFGDSLLGIVAQRLVRALCKLCKAQEPLSEHELDLLAREYVEGTTLAVEDGRQRLLQAGNMAPAGEKQLYRAVGCDVCGGKGYKGRMGIYEILENSPELKHLIQTRAATSLIFDQAIAAGTRSLKQDALEKVVAGLIDLKQARTVYQ